MIARWLLGMLDRFSASIWEQSNTCGAGDVERRAVLSCGLCYLLSHATVLAAATAVEFTSRMVLSIRKHQLRNCFPWCSVSVCA